MNTFMDSGVSRLADRDYFDFVLASVEAATRRIYAALFIYDIRPSRDVRGRVLDLTGAVSYRQAIGVDVRIALSGYLTTADISIANMATSQLLAQQGVPLRHIMDNNDGRKGLHAKFAIIDDVAIIGSQNWTHDAFEDNVEDSLIISGPAVHLLEKEFFNLWSIGRGVASRGA